MITKIFTTAFYSAEGEIKKENKPDYKVMLICVAVALSLSFIKYFGDPKFLLQILQNIGSDQLAISFDALTSSNPNAGLYRLLYWASNVIFFYVVPPFILIKFVFKEKFSDYGLSFKGAFKDTKVYLIML